MIFLVVSSREGTWATSPHTPLFGTKEGETEKKRQRKKGEEEEKKGKTRKGHGLPHHTHPSSGPKKERQRRRDRERNEEEERKGKARKEHGLPHTPLPRTKEGKTEKKRQRKKGTKKDKSQVSRYMPQGCHLFVWLTCFIYARGEPSVCSVFVYVKVKSFGWWHFKGGSAMPSTCDPVSISKEARCSINIRYIYIYIITYMIYIYIYHIKHI